MGIAQPESLTQKFFGGCHAVEGFVVNLNSGFFLFVEPAAFALLQFVFELGIELVIVYWGGAVYGVLHLHTDKTAATATVGQQVAAVAGADKASDSW
ncbi:membrane protein [gut metagenome]|uniref:Membrane protein n=1 Tax=gut metagenome TaxID=749906 RepID=J9GTV8_9ZZZZ